MTSESTGILKTILPIFIVVLTPIGVTTPNEKVICPLIMTEIAFVQRVRTSIPRVVTTKGSIAGSTVSELSLVTSPTACAASTALAIAL